MNINDQQPVTEGLRFGTAGLRAPVGPGAQEMNVTQVTRTTAGVASWLAERAAARAASGAQQHHPDPDTEGWTRACKSPPATTPPPTMDTKST